MRTILIDLVSWRRAVLILLVLALGSAACTGNGSSDLNQRPLVLVTTTILGDVVTRIADGGVQIQVLMPRGADPHDFSPSAQQAAAMRRASLIVANGAGLEAGLVPVIEAAEADGVEVLWVGDLLDLQPFADPIDDHEGGLDPHVWMDPVRMASAVEIIAAAIEPTVDGDLSTRASAYRQDILELHEEIESQVERIPADRRKLVTNHYALGYYADRYGFQLLGTVIPAATTDAETSAAEFAALIELIEREEVPAIFGSTSEPTALAEALAAEVDRDVEVVVLHTGSLGEAGSGAETYIDMMRTNTRLIVESLG